MNILLTGGTGYIGSHTALALNTEGHSLILFDNLSNSNINVINNLERIIGYRPTFIKGDMRDTLLLSQVMENYSIDAVVHFAGLKAVGESVEKPIKYFSSNIQGAISLLQAMQSNGVYKLIFSSSATVYGDPQYLPIDETHRTCATNPYGRTKLHIEELLQDLSRSNCKWRIASLRYFNPVGAHESGFIGENPDGIPNNLMPFIAKVASGKLESLKIFGNNYPTHDGTGVRDYIHVADLADGHLLALHFLEDHSGWNVFNLGTGKGYSVLDMINVFQKISGKEIPFEIVGRRPGDVAACYADVNKALIDLKWSAQRTIDDMCASMWNYQRKNF